MQKIDDLLSMIKMNELLGKKEPPKVEKKCNPILWILAILGTIAVIAGIAYALYHYFTPDYLEDFEDDFDDEFDDEFFEEEKLATEEDKIPDTEEE